MINSIHPAESGKINIAPNALLLSQERYYEILRSVDAVMQATRNLPAKNPPKDVVALSIAEQKEQPKIDQQFNEIVERIQSEEANVPAPSDYISLKGDEHPNQAAIDEAMLLAMEAYENNESQDLRV